MNEQWIIPILAGVSTIALGGALLVARRAKRAPLEARLRDLEDLKNATLNGPPPISSMGSKYSNLVGSIGSVVTPKIGSSGLRAELAQAGYHRASSAAIYFGAKMLLLVLGLGAGALIALPTALSLHIKLLILGVMAGLLFFIPNLVVAGRRSARRTEVSRHLPDAVDLLEICASAGMGLDMAWNSVADEVRPVSNILADEMALTNLEIHLGAPRAAAMRHMAQRTGAEALSSMVAVLVQSERFGTSIGEALRIYAQTMRESRSQQAQESAEKMAVKLIFPMVLFIFPAVVMVMAGPGLIMLYRALAAR